MNAAIPSRREFLWRLGGGLGGIALTHLLGQQGLLAGATLKGRPEWNGGLHHRAKATRVIQLFMNGGASPMDTFDYKPQLAALHGKKFDPGTSERVEAATSEPGTVMKSPFDFKQHGQCGRWVSSVFPHVAGCVDELAFLMAMASKTNVHGPGSYMMNTGFLLPGFPSMGSWISYGLGSLTEDLPTFVVMPDPKGLPYNNKGNFSSGFLPAAHGATVINGASIPSLSPPASAAYINPAAEADGRALLRRMNERFFEQNAGDTRLNARAESYELAARMQLSAPGIFDLSGESAATTQLYGLDDKVTADYGRRCLVARRMIERGVRFVQVWSGAGGPTNNWDNHADIAKELPPMAAATDQPIAGLLKDLKGRGLLDDTLVVWSTEFGRMPFTQGSAGRDHNGGTFVGWLAGAGIKAGSAQGESDEWAWKTKRGKTYCYDLHATILHLLGINHEKLTFLHNGVERRLTDVHGHVIDEVLA